MQLDLVDRIGELELVDVYMGSGPRIPPFKIAVFGEEIIDRLSALYPNYAAEVENILGASGPKGAPDMVRFLEHFGSRLGQLNSALNLERASGDGMLAGAIVRKREDSAREATELLPSKDQDAFHNWRSLHHGSSWNWPGFTKYVGAPNVYPMQRRDTPF